LSVIYPEPGAPPPAPGFFRLDAAESVAVWSLLIERVRAAISGSPVTLQFDGCVGDQQAKFVCRFETNG
jgi:hypothetical protein